MIRIALGVAKDYTGASLTTPDFAIAPGPGQTRQGSPLCVASDKQKKKILPLFSYSVTSIHVHILHQKHLVHCQKMRTS